MRHNNCSSIIYLFIIELWLSNCVKNVRIQALSASVKFSRQLMQKIFDLLICDLTTSKDPSYWADSEDRSKIANERQFNNCDLRIKRDMRTFVIMYMCATHTPIKSASAWSVKLWFIWFCQLEQCVKFLGFFSFLFSFFFLFLFCFVLEVFIMKFHFVLLWDNSGILWFPSFLSQLKKS